MKEFKARLMREVGGQTISLEMSAGQDEDFDRLEEVSKFMRESGKIFRMDFRGYCHQTGTIQIMLVPDNGVMCIKDSEEAGGYGVPGMSDKEVQEMKKEDPPMEGRTTWTG